METTQEKLYQDIIRIFLKTVIYIGASILMTSSGGESSNCHNF